MATARAVFQAHVDGLGTGATWPLLLEWAVSAAIGELDSLTLSSGFNALTAPTGSTLVIFIPPSANTQTITLKGITEDTGVSLSKTAPTILAVAGTAWGLTVGGDIAGCSIVYL